MNSKNKNRQNRPVITLTQLREARAAGLRCTCCGAPSQSATPFTVHRGCDPLAGRPVLQAAIAAVEAMTGWPRHTAGPARSAGYWAPIAPSAPVS